MTVADWGNVWQCACRRDDAITASCARYMIQVLGIYLDTP
jgi:hypothetical protein